LVIHLPSLGVLFADAFRNTDHTVTHKTRSDSMLSLVQLSLALLLPGSPTTRLSGGSRTAGIVAQETRDADKEYASSCYLPTDWMPLALLEKKEYNHDSTLYDFELPKGTSLNLPACACILLLAPGAEKDGADAVRPYTPISPNEVTGCFPSPSPSPSPTPKPKPNPDPNPNQVTGRFQLLVKRYAQGLQR